MKFLPVLRTKQELYAYYLPEYSLRALRVYSADASQLLDAKTSATKNTSLL